MSCTEFAGEIKEQKQSTHLKMSPRIEAQSRYRIALSRGDTEISRRHTNLDHMRKREEVSFFFPSAHSKCAKVSKRDTHNVQAPRVTGYFAPQVYLPSLTCMAPVASAGIILEPAMSILPIVLCTWRSARTREDRPNASFASVASHNHALVLMSLDDQYSRCSARLELLADLNPLLGGEGLGAIVGQHISIREI